MEEEEREEGIALATTMTTTVALAALGQAHGISAALHSLAGHLAHTTNEVCATLHRLTEEASDVAHFY